MKKEKADNKDLTTLENQPEVAESKTRKAIKTVFNVIVNILTVLILIISVLIAAMSITAKANNGLPSIFGYTIQSIQSPSMEGGSDEFPGGDLKKGDLIIGKATQFIYDRVYQKGDIITYMGLTEDSGDVKVPICHRIIEVYNYNGYYTYRTMGDNNGRADQEEGDYAKYIRADEIGSVFYSEEYQGVKISGLGSILDFIQTKVGFFVCILLPMIIFFIVALIRVLINATIYRKEQEKEAKENAEKEKEEAVDAAVAAALAEKEKKSGDMTPEDMTPEQMEQFKQFLAFQEAQKSQQATDTPAETPTETPAEEPVETPESTEE